MSDVLVCHQCKTSLIESPSDVCFYKKSSTEVHLSIKPERRIALLATQKIKIQQPSSSSTTSKSRNKSIPILCGFCENQIGSEIPWGPHNTKFIAFSIKGTISFGIVHPPKTKARDILPHHSYKSLEVRTHDNFIRDIPPAVRVNITPLLPSEPLRLPSLNELSLLSSSQQLPGIQGTYTTPRPYQIESYLNALHQNSICVLPTGCGKTLVASLLVAQLKKQNPTHMALFLVDRIPLVFQQSHALAKETDLRVCPLCGETKTQNKVKELNDGKYDILCATAGCFWELALKKEVDGRQFCAVVFDECHHSKKGHMYVKILDWLREQRSGPRILGLTASPVSGKSHPQMVKRLNEMSRLFHDAVVFAPETPNNSVKVTWVKMTRDAYQDRFALDMIDRLKKIAEEASQYLPGRLNVFRSDLVLSLDELLQPSTLGRLRGLANRLSEDNYNNPTNPIHGLVAEMARLTFCLELADVMGLKHALSLLSSPLQCSVVPPRLSVGTAQTSDHSNTVLSSDEKNFMPNHAISVQSPPIQMQEAPNLHSTTTFDASRYPKDHVSPRLKHLTSILLQHTNQRILVLVSTRATARDLTSYLQSHTTISSTFNPLKIVGHGGYDGMTWADEQSATLGMFRRGESRLIVSTSVLEEGLDVPQCDLVIRIQGVTSLIGFVQSRGRARKENSRMMVVVNEWEKRRVDEMREQEILARMAIRTISSGGVVEEHMRRLNFQINSEDAVKNKKEWNLNPVVTLRVWIPNLETSRLRQFEKVETDDCVDEIELMECALTRSFEKAGLSAIRVFRLDKLTNDVGVDQVFDNSLGYLIGIADITCLSEEGDLSMDAQAVTSCETLIRDSWNYKVCDTTVWVSPSVGECDETKQNQTFENCECFLGIWDDSSTFTKRYHIDDVLLVDFKVGGDIEISYKIVYWIHVSRIIIQDFILIDWNEHGTGNINMFLPLGSAPTCYNEDERNCNINDPVLQNFGINNVLCITFTSQEMKTKISNLRQSHLTQNVFDTRVIVFDKMYDTDHDEFTIDSKSYHENQLPSFTPSQGETRDVHWLLLVLFSLRKGCFTPRVKKYLVSFVINKFDSIPLGELTPTIIQMSGRPIHAIIHALTCCQNVRYWSNIIPLFNSSYDIFIKTSSNCDVDTYAFSAHRPLARMQQNEYKIYSTIITPTRVIYLPFQYTQGSRLFKNFGSSSFVTVTFRDEQNNNLQGEGLLTYVQSYIADGLKLAGQPFYFFLATSNQLRNQKATFVNADILPGEGDITLGLRLMREQIIQPDGEEVTMAKYLSRLALFGTTCRPTVNVLQTDVIKSPDVMTSSDSGVLPTVLTDGAGKISRSLAKKVTELLDLNVIPSAFQIRWAGAKGVVVVVDDNDCELQGRKMLIRHSMVKFQMGDINDWTLGVVSYSRWLESHLNREIISLLTSIHDKEYEPEMHIHRLQENELKTAYMLFTDQDVALRELDGELNQFTKEALKLIKNTGVPLTNIPFFVGLLRTHYRTRIRMIVDKTRIPFRQGSLLMGVPDPIGILKEGEVYVSIDPDENSAIGESQGSLAKNDDASKNEKIILNQNVTIWRNPCLHPGDVRTVKAVPYIELSKWRNVIIFPNKKGLKRNIPLECSGGDLDGDLFYVLWDKTIIQPPRCNFPPLNYESFGIATHEQAELSKNSFFDNADLSEFVHDVYSNDTLGQVATMHLALSDIQKLGARDEISMELAMAQSYAVDFPKTGVPPVVPNEAIEILKSEGYPDFMRKHNCYTSIKFLGYCYRRAASFDVNYDRNSTFSPGVIQVKEKPKMIHFDTVEKCLIIPGSSTFSSDAKSACEAYVLAFNRIKNSYGLRTETEVFLGRGTHWHPYISNRGRASVSIHEKIESLQCDFRNLFHKSYPTYEDAEKVASAWFQAARKSGCLSLELIIAAEIYAGIYRRISSRLSSPEIYSTTRVAKAICCYFQETRHKEHILSLAEPKLAALEMLQSVLSKNEKDKYIAQPFGSFALGLLDNDSDIDIVVFDIPTHPDHCHIDLQQKQSYFLDKISPLIEDHVENKVDSLNARVPIIRCSIPSSLQSTEKIRIDIVNDGSAFLKSLWLQELFKKRKDLYITFIVLTLWARAVGFVKKDTFQEIVVDLRLLSMGKFHIIILTMLKEALNDSFQSIRIRRDVLLDLFSNAHKQQQNSHAHKALIDIIGTRDESILNSAANLIVTFFKRINDVCQNEIVRPITFVWKDYLPAIDSVTISSETVSPECVRKLELHTAPSLHCLLSHSDINFFLEVAAGETEIVTFTRKLPLNLSYRIAGAITFHEQRFGMISGAEVSLQEQNYKPSVLLTAKGSRRSIQILKEELNKCANMSRWGCRSWVQSSRYFMEDSSFLVVNGVNDVSTNVRFIPNNVLQQVRKLGSHNEVSVVIVHNIQNIGETDYSKLNDVRHLLPVTSFASALRRQVARMPCKTRFNYISLTVSFGSFVALNVSESLPETSVTLSIDELLQGMNKNGRKRKHWERKEFDTTKYKAIRGPSKIANKTRLKKIKPSVPQANQRKTRKKKMHRTGIRTTFFPSFNTIKNVEGVYRLALMDSGFKYQKETIENQVQISSALTRGFEVQLMLEVDSSNNFWVESAVERPLNWIHGTILGSEKVPDARIRLQTTNSISEVMKNLALPRGLIPIVMRPDGIIDFNEQLTEDEKSMVVYVRHLLKNNYYSKTVYLKSSNKHTSISARIALVREYVRIEDGSIVGPSERCELRLEFDHDQLFERRVDYEELALVIVCATNELTNALKNQDML